MSVRAAYCSGFTPELDAAFSTYGLGWHHDASIQFLRLVLAGTFDRMPGLQMILGHRVELVLFYAERLAAMDRRVAGLVGDKPIAVLTHNDAIDYAEWWRERVVTGDVTVKTANKDLGQVGKQHHARSTRSISPCCV